MSNKTPRPSTLYGTQSPQKRLKIHPEEDIEVTEAPEDDIEVTEADIQVTKASEDDDEQDEDKNCGAQHIKQYLRSVEDDWKQLLRQKQLGEA